MGNPNASPAEKQMATKIANLLMTPQCQKIDYMLNETWVSGSLYSFIALSIVSPLNNVSNIGVTVKAMPVGTEAQYIIASNNIEVPSQTYGSTPFQRMTFVHECTHAALDARRSKYALPRLLNETCAYISGALFNVYLAGSASGPFGFNPGAGIYAEAHKLAIKMRKNQDRFSNAFTYALYQSDVAALQNAIKASPTYAGFFDDPAETYGDDGVDL